MKKKEDESPSLQDRFGALFGSAIARAEEQVQRVQGAADRWYNAQADVVIARASKALGLPSNADAEARAKDTLLDLVASIDQVDGVQDLLRELNSASHTPRPPLLSLVSLHVDQEPEQAEATPEPVADIAPAEQVVPRPSRRRDLRPVSVPAPAIVRSPEIERLSRSAKRNALLVITGDKAKEDMLRWLAENDIETRWEKVEKNSPNTVRQIEYRIKNRTHCGVVFFGEFVSHNAASAVRDAAESGRVIVAYCNGASKRTLEEACHEIGNRLALDVVAT